MKKVVDFVRLDRGTFARHLAVLAASLAAFLLREPLAVGRWVPWIFGAAGALNFLAFLTLTSGDGALRRAGRVASPLVGVVGWAGLIAATGGAGRSPFVAGLGLEILLAAAASPPRGILAVTGACVLGLWAQELLRGAGESLVAAIVESTFLIVAGGVLWAVVLRWTRERATLSRGLTEQEQRLATLQRELEDTRHVARLGEGAGRLAHGLKNAVHSLRGLTRLVQAHVAESCRAPAAAELLRDLQDAVDRLDELARASLGPCRSAGSMLAGERARRPLEEAIRRLEEAFPGMRCELRFEPPPEGVVLSEEMLRDVTTNLVLNAAEAMHGRGDVLIEAGRENDEWRVRVTDRGEGIAREKHATLFRPGFTTKPRGTGVGLYLCRRLVEAAGGRIALLSQGSRGTSFQFAFPLDGKS